MIAEPVKRDFTVPQGATYPIKMRWLDSNNNPIDLTGADIKAQLRKEFDSPQASIECTLVNGKATLESGTWYFGFILTSTDTAAIEATSYYYDLVVTRAGDVTRAMEGKISITPRVTK
jgi:hypothetical protein